MGYFEVADKGTLFLTVAEPLSHKCTVRALEAGEFIRVGSSQVQKTDVRVIAATNVNLHHAIKTGKFRRFIFRLNTVPILVRLWSVGDIHLLFRKFAADFAEKYKMPVIRLTDGARNMLEHYRWPGNVRQLKNVAEQLSVLEHNRNVTAETLQRYLPADSPLHLPVVYDSAKSGRDDFISERDILYKILFQLRSEIDEMKEKMDLLQNQEVYAAPGHTAMLSHTVHEHNREEEVTEGRYCLWKLLRKLKICPSILWRKN